LSEYVIHHRMKSANRPSALIILPLALITLFCFSFVLMQPTKTQRYRKVSSRQADNSSLSGTAKAGLPALSVDTNISIMKLEPAGESTNTANMSPQTSPNNARSLQSAVPNSRASSNDENKSSGKTLINMSKPVTSLLNSY
jgi:hypothetical protein